jgi:hypothetical protein
METRKAWEQSRQRHCNYQSKLGIHVGIDSELIRTAAATACV